MSAPPPLDRRAHAALLGIVAFGAVLRLWTIADGAPYISGVDEPEIVERVLRMLRTGDFHPHFFDYPGLTFSLHLIVGAARFLAGAMSREWASLDGMWSGDLLVWSRVVTALLSTATIAIAARIGFRWGTRAGLVAALAMAVQPQLVQNAHFVLTDTPLTFFVTAALLAAIRAGETGGTKAFAIAGMLAGLAAASKYNGAVVALAPLLIALAAPGIAARGAAIAAAIGGAAAGFVLGAPYSVLDLPGFLNGFANLMQHYNQSRPALETADLYRKYMQDWFGMPGVLRREFTWLATLLCAAGFVTVAKDLGRSAARAPAMALLIFAVAYFSLIARQSLVYSRYAMPLAPVLAIAFGIGVARIAAWIASRAPQPWVRRLALPVLVILPLTPPLATAVGLNLDRRKVSTTEQAATWLAGNVPAEARVIIETATIRLPPDRFASDNALSLAAAPLDHYRAAGVTYLVTNSMEYDKYYANPARFSREIGVYNEIFRAAEPVQTFTPSADHPGPTIRVFKIVR